MTLTGAAIIAAMAAAVLTVLWSRGVFSRRAFDRAPRRAGRLGLPDLVVGLGLILVGPGAAVILVAALAGTPAPGDMTGMLWILLASQAGALPAIAYTLVRASMAVEGGIGGLGLGARALPIGIGLSLLGIVAVVPLLALTGILVNALSTLLGQEAPAIAHALLRVLAEEPWGPVRWGLILSAVIVAPLVEEIIFRGLVQTSLVQSPILRGRWTAILIASAVFVLMHLGMLIVPAEQPVEPERTNEPIFVMSAAHHADGAAHAPHRLPAQVPPPNADDAPGMRFAWQALPILLLLSIALGYAYERTGNLWVPIGIHALFNAFQITIALAMADAM